MDNAVNRKYKDRLFIRLFGYEDTKKDTLELYNAVNGSNYTDPDELTLYTIENVVYMGMKNDLAFCMESFLNLFEHQSSINPNMPVRGLMYFGKLYSKLIKERKLNIYGQRLIKLPVPRYITFYNGSDELEDQIFRLTDAFDYPEFSDVQVTVRVININPGHNEELKSKCRKLYEYSVFCGKVREYMNSENDISEAVNAAIEYCISQGILAEFLRKQKAEVLDMVITEYNEKEQLEMVARDAKEEGWKEGHREGFEDGRKEEQKNSIFRIVQIYREDTGYTDAEIKEKIKVKYNLSDAQADDFLKMKE